LVLQEGLLGHANRVLIVDDLVATGGSMLATKRLVEQAEARVVGFASIINLTYLNSEDMKRELHITQEEITK
jgi:adenine phosphoribosyltransferase